LATEYPVAFTLEPKCVRSGRLGGKIVDHQERILCHKRQSLNRIARAQPVTWEVTSVQARTEVLLREGREFSLPDAGGSSEVNRKISVTENRPEDRSNEGHRHDIGRDVEQLEALPNRIPKGLSLWGLWEREQGEGVRELGLDLTYGSIFADGPPL